MISVSEAKNIILASVHPAETIIQSLERSLRFVLAEDIVSGEDVPSFDNAAMDGYALRSEDLHSIPATLMMVGEIAAGSVTPKDVRAGEAMSIMTGAKIPVGCDAVVQQEWSKREDESWVTILRQVEHGHNIRPAGADIQRGETVLKKGHRLRPQEIGVLASLGKQYVEVYRHPSVAILATGNEIIDIAKLVPDGKIRNSNAYTLSALVEESGCESMRLDIAKDDHNDLQQKLMKGLAADMLITTGGVSVGKYDLVMDVLKEIGVEIKFWKVNIKPGMPIIFGMYGTKPVFGLPGNPVSTMITFRQFVKPALRKMMGEIEEGSPLTIRAKLQHEITKNDGKRHFVRGIAEHRNGSLMVRTTGSQISNILSSLTKANCLIILPEEKELFHAGDEVEIDLL